ncbi:MAG TPA: CpXC domain-containing protein [Anaerolineae bacterium]
MRTQVKCPQCGTPYLAEVHQVIDTRQNPELKQQLLSGQLNLAICPNCGAGGQISTVLLFHDPEHELFMVHVPHELNLNQVQREEIIGQLSQQVMNNTPPEQRRAYMFQPQMILNMQTFMEKVLETEGITPEMIARQRKQAELLRTLATADKDVADLLIKERMDEIDETFFAMLQSTIDAASQTNDNKQLLPLVNLRARLMTETPAGRRLEKRQVALHKFNQDARKQGGLTPELLLKHIVANQEDEDIVNALVLAGQGALSYQFFQLLTEEIEKQEKSGDQAGAQHLSEIRTNLLQLYDAMQQQSQQILKTAENTLESILTAPDKKAAIKENQEQIDDAFMYVLSARIAEAEQKGKMADAQALNELYELILEEAESELPPEIRLLNQLVRVKTEKEQARLIEENQELVSPELLMLVERILEQAQEAGQEELNGRLQSAKSLIEARL